MTTNTSSSSSSARYVNLCRTKAHVFYVNPEDRSKWKQTANNAVDVSLVTSIEQMDGQNPQQQRRELRLVGVDPDTGETVLDDIVTKTNFDKRSQKFFQWIDSRKILWGLGFENEIPLEDFLRNVEHYKLEMVRQQNEVDASAPSKTIHQSSPPQQHQQQADNVVNANSQPNPRGRLTSTNSQQQQISSNNLPLENENQHSNVISNGNNSARSNGHGNNNDVGGHHSRSQSTIGQAQNRLSIRRNPDDASDNQVTNTGDNSEIQKQVSLSLEELKYENDGLRRAMKELSSNAGLWQQEVLNLRTNNVKLTQALQESKANVAEWEIQLTNLKEANEELKMKMKSFESNGNSTDIEKKLHDYKAYVDELEREVSAKDKDIEQMQKSLDELELNSKQIRKEDQINNNLSQSMDLHQKQLIKSLRDRLYEKVGELNDISQELKLFVDKI